MCVSEQRIRCGAVFVWAIAEALSVSQQTVQVSMTPHEGCLHILSSHRKLAEC